MLLFMSGKTLVFKIVVYNYQNFILFHFTHTDQYVFLFPRLCLMFAFILVSKGNRVKEQYAPSLLRIIM